MNGQVSEKTLGYRAVFWRSGCYALAFVLGVCSTFLWANIFPPQANDYKETHETDGQYFFINPLLACERGEMLQQELKNFKAAVESYVNLKTSRNPQSHVSVYFRDLNNGPWFGINEREMFLPASLLKVPLLMSLYREAEKNPQLLEQSVMLEGPEVTEPQQYPPRQHLTIGTQYTVGDIGKHMITFSDNTAAQQLAKIIGMDNFFDIYTHLGIEFPRDKEITIGTRTYGSFFRILFNASYLNRDSSETILKLLSETDFRDGLVAGVPGHVRVSHKFGESRSPDGQSYQLHDCGIVYATRPYLLCVMSRGQDVKSMAQTISNISRLVYDEFEAQQ